MRWEMYSYHYDQTDMKRSNMRGMGGMLLPNPLPMEDVIIHSRDFYNAPTVMGPDIHIYRSLSELALPHFGQGHAIQPDGSLVLESVYIVTTAEDAVANAQLLLDTLSLPCTGKVLSVLLRRYKCNHISVFNKLNGEVLIKYSGVSVGNYLEFLIEFEYPANLKDHATANVDQYRDIIHEIAIVYNGRTGLPVRTSFYGVL